jgi:hypothetical protein
VISKIPTERNASNLIEESSLTRIAGQNQQEDAAENIEDYTVEDKTYSAKS